MINHHLSHSWFGSTELFTIIFCLLAVGLYIFAVRLSNKHYRKWPTYRLYSWIFGVLSVALSVAGPLADQAHIDFRAHMSGHLLLGMLGPFLIAMSSPMTLLLRSLNILWARRITRLLKTKIARLFTHPVITTLLNIGGLWILYTTDLYMAMHHHLLLHILVHLHVFIAGYLFTISMIYTEPTPHRHGFMYRAVVMILAFAGHGILSKYLYAHPPEGVTAAQAEMGSLIMYYGGDAIDLALIFVFCLQWFHYSRPHSAAPPNRSLI